MGLGFKKKKAVKWHSFFKSGCKTCICQNSLKYIFFSIKGVESQSLNHTRSEHAEIDANTMILNYLIKTIFMMWVSNVLFEIIEQIWTIKITN